MSDAIVKYDGGGITVSAQWRQSTEVAGAVKDFALKRVLTIQGKRYPPVEVWQAIANAFQCVASARDVKKVDGGWSAVGEVRRMSDGGVIAEGEGFLGEDEKVWATRPMFAKRAMAQTRAISRACRSAFAFVIPLIDAGLQTTPYEEMEAMGAEAQAQPVPPQGTRTAQLKAQVSARVAKAAVEEMPEPPPDDVPPPGFEEETPHEGRQEFGPPMTFGKSKDVPLSKLSPRDLAWYEQALSASVEDPSKARFLSKNQAQLDAVRAEISGRG